MKPRLLDNNEWRKPPLKHDGHLEGQGDLVSRLLTPLTHIATQLTPIMNLLTKSP